MASDDTEEGFTLSMVRAALHRWGDLVLRHGDASLDGWGWSPENMLAKWQTNDRARRAGKRVDLEVITLAEASVLALDHHLLRDVATIARFVKQLKPLQVNVLACTYVHRMSATDLAEQLGAKVSWVRDTRTDTEQQLRKWLNGLRTVRVPDTAKQSLTKVA